MAKATPTTAPTDTLTPFLVAQARYDERHLEVFHVCQAAGCTATDDRLVYCGDRQFTLCDKHRKADVLLGLMPAVAVEPEPEAPVIETPAEPVAEGAA